MPFSYIIYSRRIDKYYIGACKECLEFRIEKHNTSFFGTKAFTSQVSDWELYIDIEVQDYDHAIRLERKIKSMKSRKYIENLKNYPELRNKIISETR